MHPTVHRIAAFALAAAVLALAPPGLYGQAAAKALLKPSPPAQQQPAEASKPAPPPDPNPPIALPDIADRAEQLDRMLGDFSKELAPSVEQLEAETSIQTDAADIRRRDQQLEPFLASTPNPLELQEEDRYWRALSEQYTAYRKLLTARAGKLEEQTRALDGAQAQWQATLNQIKSNKGIEAVVERVNRALRDLQRASAATRVELNRVLNLQTLVSQQDQAITGALRRLDETRNRLRGRLLARDSQPLWKARELRVLDDSVTAIAYRSAHRSFMGAQEFFRAKARRFILVAALYAVALLLALRFKRELALGKFAHIPPEASAIFDRPYTVALLIALLGTIGQNLAAPPGFVFVICLLYALQMVRLTPLLTRRNMVPVLYALAAFSLLQGCYLVVQVSPLLRRELLALLVLAAIVTFAWLIRPAVLRTWDLSDRKLRVALAGIRVGVALLSFSLLANVLGFVSLSQMLGVTTLLGGYAAVLMYGVVRILKLMLALGTQSWAVSLGERREALERWGGAALTVAGITLWLDAALYLVGAHGTVAEAVARARQYPLGFAKIQFLAGDLMDAILVLLVGYLLANVFIFLIRELILSRMGLSRGLPHAVSTILYYLVLVLVSLTAVSELGVELNKLTLITGALGIGVGFGLQTTVSNFVSGLILLFERPIRVGDVVEVAGVVGHVRRIGVRSSTIHTFDDAEVIVPNNDLITNKVTNWTLSSPRRRVDVAVGIAYGTEPGKVLKLLVGVAEATPGILRQPRPVAFFLGFGESALNFEVRFWSTQDSWFQLKSDVSVAMAKALREAGIEIPFPQRDLHLRSVEGEVRSALHLAAPREPLSAAARRSK